tara:strand:- start:851 stop:1021 length:171 start_codon:yes stop_codon:yes gene_type:complete
MSKSSLILIIYIIGIIFGAFFLDLWGSETSVKKGLLVLIWTAIFLVAYVYSGKKKE